MPAKSLLPNFIVRALKQSVIASTAKQSAVTSTPRLLILFLIITLLLSTGCGGQPTVTSEPTGRPDAISAASSSDVSATSPAESPSNDLPSTGGSAGRPADPPQPSPTPTPPPLPDELLTITGQVSLPPEIGLSLEGLSLLTNLGSVPVDSSGAFQAEMARNPALPSLVLLLNAVGNPVLLASRRGAEVAQPWDISLESTARALVLFDPSVWSLATEQQDQLEAAMLEHSYYQYLGETVLSTIQSDPQDPLNGDLHQDSYGIAALITGELVKSVSQSKQSSLPLFSKALFSPRNRPLAGRNEFVWVEDDFEHNLPEVTLVNNTFCYYNATIYAGPEGSAPTVWNNTDKEPLVLDKSKLYSIRFMPTAGSNMGTERSISPGDGNLRFVFKLDKRATVYEMGMTVMSAIVGGMGMNVAQKDKVVYGLLKESIDSVYGELMILIGSSKGKSSEELAGEVVTWFAKNTVQVLLMYGEAMSAEWKEKASSEYLKKAGGIFGSKLYAGVMAGYTFTDVGTTAYSLANSPEEISEQGLQRQGLYPAIRLSALPEVIRLPDVSQMSLFLPSKGSAQAAELATAKLVVIVEDVPDDMSSLQIYINYMDGSPPVQTPVTAENGRVTLEDIHTFIGLSPAVQVEVLDFLTSKPIIGITVPVVIGAAATNKMFTLRFEYEPGACTNWQCESGWSSCSRVNTNIPVRLIGEDKLVVAYTFDNFEKHMTAYGSGSLSGTMLNLYLEANFALDKTCPKGDTWEPCQLKENAQVTISGPFNPTLDYEQGLLAGGVSSVNWPLSEPPPSRDNSLKCTATVVRAFLYPGYTNYGR
jgi:hypothetical protein